VDARGGRHRDAQVVAARRVGVQRRLEEAVGLDRVEELLAHVLVRVRVRVGVRVRVRVGVRVRVRVGVRVRVRARVRARAIA